MLNSRSVLLTPFAWACLKACLGSTPGQNRLQSRILHVALADAAMSYEAAAELTSACSGHHAQGLASHLQSNDSSASREHVCQRSH